MATVPGESKSSARRIEARLRQAQALRLRMGGASFDDIARQLGYQTKGGAYRAVEAALRDVPKHDAEAYRALNLERLNRMFLALFPDAITPATLLADRQRAAAECRAIIAEINKLVGAYAPERIKVMLEEAVERAAEVEARERGLSVADVMAEAKLLLGVR